MDNIRLLLYNKDTNDIFGEWIISSDYDERLVDKYGISIVLMSELPPDITDAIMDNAYLKAAVLSNVLSLEEEAKKTRK